MSIAFSMGKAKRVEMTTSPNAKFVPGPGTHQPKTSFTNKQTPKWVFGTGVRQSLQNKTASKDLGPGAYDIQSKTVENQQYSMGMINHKQKKYHSIAPGPGTYKPVASNEVSLRYSMGAITTNKELSASKSRKLPGPGNYDPSNSYNSSIKYQGNTRFGKSKREGIYNERQARFVPSPFAYKQGKESVVKTAPKFSFGNQKQRPRTSKYSVSTPGPGQYPIKQLVGNENQGKTLHSKLNPSFERPGANKVPGPGSYQDLFKNAKKNEPRWIIGTSKRDQEMKRDLRTKNYPPPNSYTPQYTQTLNTSEQWGFGSGKRKGLTDGKNCAPSMQSYNIPSRAVEGSKWFMGQKLQNGGAINTSGLQVPGPGTYNAQYESSAEKRPQYSMKGRYVQSAKLNVPGPGTYPQSLSDKKQSPQYGFGSSPQREKIRKTLSPGPGGYHIPCTIAEVPAYAMPGRKDEFKYI